MADLQNNSVHPPYASLAEMQDAYLRLSEEYERAGDCIPAELRPQFAEFLGRAVETGVILESASERRSAQGLIDYWTGRLGESATYAGASRPQPLRRYNPEQAPELPEEACPYVGLSPYQAADAARFFGREELSRQVVVALKRYRIVLICGGVGSGKTSLVQAGVLPALKNNAIAGSQDWRYVTLTPGAQAQWPREFDRAPKAALAALVEESTDGQARENTLIFVDQVEELFTLASPKTRASYMDAIMRAASRPDLRILLALRKEFEGQLTDGGLLPGASMSGQPLPSVLQVVPLAAAELRAAIEKPAAKIGLLFESGVVDRMVGEFLGDPTGLPLLQVTLRTLWRGRSRNRIPLAAYDSLGGGRAVLAEQARLVVEGLPQVEQDIARRILLRMVRPQEGSAVEVMRVSARVRDILATEPTEMRQTVLAVVATLVRERLLHQIGISETASEEHLLELAHEALARHWPKLNGWVALVQLPLRQRRRWEALVSEWRRAGMGSTGLLDAGEIEELNAWLASPEAQDIGFDRGLFDFLDRSRAAIARQKRNIERAMRFALVAGGLVVVVTVIALGVLSMQYRKLQESSDALAVQRTELVEERGRQLLTEQGMPHQAALWLNEALMRGSRSKALRPLLAEALRPLAATRAILVEPNHSAVDVAKVPEVSDATFAPDGRSLVSASHDGALRMWDVDSGRLIRRMAGHEGEVRSVSYSPDGRYIVSAGVDKMARVWLAESGDAPLVLKHGAAVLSAEYSPDGRRIVTALADGKVQIWDVASQRVLGELSKKHSDEVMAASYSPNGRYIVTGSKDKSVRLWDGQSFQFLQTLGTHGGAVWSVAFSPDGETLVTSSMDNTAQVWEVASGRRVTTLQGDTGPVYSAAYSPDGKHIVTGSDDNAVRVWDARSGLLESTLTGHSRAVASVGYGPDGHVLLSSSADGSVRIWHADLGQPQLIIQGAEHDLGGASYSPDGTMLVTWAVELEEQHPDSHLVRIWDASSGQPLRSLDGHKKAVLSAAFSSDGQRLVTTSADHTARIWDLASPPRNSPDAALFDRQAGLAFGSKSGSGAGVLVVSLPAVVMQYQGQMSDAAFSPDGQRIVTAGSDKVARVFAAHDGKLLRKLVHETSMSSVAFSPDGKHILTTSQDDVAFVWDGESGNLLRKLVGHTSSVVSASYSRDGQRIVTASVDKTARIWDAASGQMLRTLRGHIGPVLSVGFSPDGTQVVTAGGDRTARLWDSDSGKASVTLRGHMQAVLGARFSPDGTRVVTAGMDHTLRSWDVRPEARDSHDVAKLLACRVALRLDGVNIVPQPLDQSGCERLPRRADVPEHWTDRDRELLIALYALRAGQPDRVRAFLPQARAALTRFADPLLSAQVDWVEATLSAGLEAPAPASAATHIGSLALGDQRPAWEAMSAVAMEYLYRPRWALWALEQAMRPELLVDMSPEQGRRLAANRIEVLLAAGESARALREGMAAWQSQNVITDRIVLSALLWLAAVRVNDVVAQRLWSEQTLRYYSLLSDGTMMNWSFVGSRQIAEQAPASAARSTALRMFGLLTKTRDEETLKEFANLFARDVPSDALKSKKQSQDSPAMH